MGVVILHSSWREVLCPRINVCSSSHQCSLTRLFLLDFLLLCNYSRLFLGLVLWNRQLDADDPWGLRLEALRAFYSRTKQAQLLTWCFHSMLTLTLQLKLKALCACSISQSRLYAIARLSYHTRRWVIDGCVQINDSQEAYPNWDEI